MANCESLSRDTGRIAIGGAVADVALARGRDLPPRALWDLASELALSGLDVSDEDPCFAIARVRDEDDEAQLVQGLACNAALETASSGLLLQVAARDPGYRPTARAHEILSEAGLNPAADGDCLTAWLAGGTPHPAVERAALSLTRTAPSESARSWRRVLARAAWLGGEMSVDSTLDEVFSAAINAQARGSSEDDNTRDADALYAALGMIEDGVAHAFGIVSEPERYYPTSATPPGASAELLVAARLLQDGDLGSQPDPVMTSNPVSAEIVGYRPLVFTIHIASRAIAVDYPLWTLLRRAANGTIPTAVELERFLALRQAVRLVGVRAGADPARPLMVRERGATGRRFRLVVRNAATGAMRATEVV